MFRVTIRQAGTAESWELEGSLSGKWAQELERCWRERTSNGTGALRQVHLKAVSYIDADGKRLLSEMYKDGAEIKACGCMARAVVEEVVREKEPRGAEAQTRELNSTPTGSNSR